MPESNQDVWIECSAMQDERDLIASGKKALPFSRREHGSVDSV
jgi:hypothetical protein